jgi:hypothetical protein
MLPRETPARWLSLGRMGVHLDWQGIVQGRWMAYARVFQRPDPRVPWDLDAATGQPWLEPVCTVGWHFDGMIVEVRALMNQPRPSWWGALMKMGRVIGARAYQRERWHLATRTKEMIVRRL